MEPLPIKILLVTDRKPGSSIVERAITDIIGTRLILCEPEKTSEMVVSSEIHNFNLICVEESTVVDALALLKQLRPRERRLWVIVMVPTLGNTTRIRQLFRYGAADVLLPEELGRETLRDASIRDDTASPPSMKGPTALLIREIVEHINGGFCTLTPDGAISYSNRHFSEMAGVSEEELLGLRLTDLLSRGGRAIETLSDFPPHPFEVDLQSRRSGTLPALLSYYPLNAGAALPHAICILSDLSEIKSAQVQMLRSKKELQKKEALLGSLLKNIPHVAIAALDADGDVEIISEGAQHIFGRSPDALRGTSFHELFEQLEQDTSTEDLLSQLSKQPLSFSFIAQKSDGERLPSKAVMGPRFEDGRFSGYVGVYFDQKNERSLQERLIQHERLSAIGELIAGVAHDLNNPLAGIAGFCEILQATGTSNEKAQHYLSIISSQTDRCRHIVENLLSFARPKADEQDALVDFNAMLDKILDLRSYHFNKHRITINKCYQEKLSSTTGDYYKLQQVFYNLIYNAEQALRTHVGDKREITISTQYQDDRFVISVGDSGPGVPDRLKQRIFDSFFSTKGPGKGTGLGLSISCGVVKEHGGEIAVSDSNAGGALFTVTLPQRVKTTRRQHARSPRAPIDVKDKKILVIDDESTILNFYQEYFRSLGSTIDVADGGVVGLQKLMTTRYDIIISDIKMPDLTGVDIFKKAQASDETLPTRFIFSTGIIPDAETNALIEKYQLGVLRKPFTLDELHAALANF